jgi:hypothetical protein
MFTSFFVFFFQFLNFVSIFIRPNWMF